MRRALDLAFTAAAGAAAAVACLAVVGIAGLLLAKAAPALSWSFLAGTTAEAGAGGGIRWQLAGTALLVAGALALAVPLALALALARSVYAPAAWRRRFDIALFACNGVPSILFGLFGMALFGQLLGWGKSWLAGALVLGLMILPTLTVAVAERMAAIPAGYLEAAAALGLTLSQRVRAVLLPQSASGLVSGSLLGLARAAGETAPILFTAAVFSGATLPGGVRDSPVLALPYHVFVLAQDSLDPAAADRMWGAAFVLLALVAAASLVALPVRLKAHEEARHG